MKGKNSKVKPFLFILKYRAFFFTLEYFPIDKHWWEGMGILDLTFSPSSSTLTSPKEIKKQKNKNLMPNKDVDSRKIQRLLYYISMKGV